MSKNSFALDSFQPAVDDQHDRHKEGGRQAHLALLTEATALAKPRQVEQTYGPLGSGHERWPMPNGLMQQRDLQLNLSREEKDRIGKRIWKNESGGTVEGLTAWNVGEEFPSLGIGHFIWMPKGVETPFGDSFPECMEYLRSHGKTPPSWIQPGSHAPWNSRGEFYKQFNGPKLKELRTFLADTVPEQTDFIIDRLEHALPKILAGTPENERQKVQERFYKILNSGPAGVFALADYVNFKGEGAEDPVGYNHQGWGMRHVLQNMKDSDNPVRDFSQSAKEVLERRVENAPPERHEERWLKGWTNRVEAYVTNPPFRPSPEKPNPELRQHLPQPRHRR